MIGGAAAQDANTQERTFLTFSAAVELPGLTLQPGTYEVTFWQAPVATTNAKGAWTYGAPIVVKRTVKVGTKTAQLSVSLGR